MTLLLYFAHFSRSNGLGNVFLHDKFMEEYLKTETTKSVVIFHCFEGEILKNVIFLH